MTRRLGRRTRTSGTPRTVCGAAEDRDVFCPSLETVQNGPR